MLAKKKKKKRKVSDNVALTDFYEKLMFMDKKTVADGQGGFEVSWVDGALFMGGITTNTSIQTKIAEKQGVTSIYTITAGKNVILEFHDIIKRVSDGQIFRVTSNSKDMETPSISSMDFAQVSAEKWSLV